jgi:hypothetical protein
LGDFVSFLFETVGVKAQVLAGLRFDDNSLDFFESVERVLDSKFVEKLQKLFLEFGRFLILFITETEFLHEKKKVIWLEKNDCQNGALFRVSINEHVFD